MGAGFVRMPRFEGGGRTWFGRSRGTVGDGKPGRTGGKQAIGGYCCPVMLLHHNCDFK